MASRLSRVALLMALVQHSRAAMTYVGCYSNANGLTLAGTDPYETEGLCQGICINQKGNQAVLGLTAGSTCYCGNTVPSAKSKVDDAFCSTGCFGFGDHACGADGYYTVYLTGSKASAPMIDGGTATTTAVFSAANKGSGSATSSKSSSASTATPNAVTTIVSPGQTITQTAVADPATTATAKAQSSGGGTNGAAIGGAVAGVLILLILIGVAFFFWRRNRQRAAADKEYKQNQVANFMAGSKPTIPAMTGPDSRFDAEAMAHRRLSDGSIADNEDYSRRILKVTNPDNRY